jgi:hypothetical protein
VIAETRAQPGLDRRLIPGIWSRSRHDQAGIQAMKKTLEAAASLQ